MNKAEIVITRRRNEFLVKVRGRATFEYSPPLRNLVKGFSPSDQIDKFCVDLSECNAMDSTFMGVLTMLSLAARRYKAPVEIANASEHNRGLLVGLGIEKMFTFVEVSAQQPDPASKTSVQTQPPTTQPDMRERTETVLDAHKVLMDVDDANKDKFKVVVDLAKKDLDRQQEKK